MKRKISLVLPLIGMCASLLVGCNNQSGGSSGGYKPRTDITSDTLYVKKVNGLKDSFMLGMDASSVISLEDSGVKYYNHEGEEEDVFKILADNGVNYIRVRVWNNPYNSQGKGYGGGNNDIDKAVEIGKRATQYGMKLLVDFHYSDFWADPAKQMAPKAWKKMDYFEKCDALYNYTLESLNKLKSNGVKVGMVQCGNETNGGKMAGETRFSYFVGLLNQGYKAVKKVYPKALVAVHFANPEKTQNYLNWAEQLKEYGAKYDVFGSSYYPYWHGTLENLSNVLGQIATKYNKKVACLETSYAFNTENTDFFNNTIGETSGYDAKPYPFTIAGQANEVRDVVDTIVHTKNGIGVCYWEGTWISVNQSSYEANQKLWNDYGSGWATPYAIEYDPDDAGKYFGGCAVENQAFFDRNGHALESLKTFKFLKKGNNAPEYVDGIEDANISHYTYEDFTLPETVNVIYNTNEKRAVSVTWDPFDIPAAKAAGNGKYRIHGVAEHRDVYCNLTILEKNFLENYSFETGDSTNWDVTNLNPDVPFSDNGYKVKPTNENPQTGTYAFHFWCDAADMCRFEVEQSVQLSTTGTYKAQASLMGGGPTGDAVPESTQNMYLYIKVNGNIVAQQSGKVTVYKAWSDIKINNISVQAGDTVTVGMHIECSLKGIWGDIDDVMLNFVE